MAVNALFDLCGKFALATLVMMAVVSALAVWGLLFWAILWLVTQ